MLEFILKNFIPVLSTFTTLGLALWSYFSKRSLQKERQYFLSNFETLKNQLRLEYLRSELKTTQKFEIYPHIYGEFLRILEEAEMCINARYDESIYVTDIDSEIRAKLIGNNNTDREINEFIRINSENNEIKNEKKLSSLFRSGKIRAVCKRKTNTKIFFHEKSLFISSDCTSMCNELFFLFENYLANVQMFILEISPCLSYKIKQERKEQITLLLFKLEAQMQKEIYESRYQ